MMSKFLGFIKLYRLPILSGVLFATSYAPFPCWALLFSYAPLWLFVTDEKRTLREVFWGAWVHQFVLSLIGFYWVTYVIHEFGQIPWVLSVVVLLIFCALVHLYIPIAHAATILLQRKFKLSVSLTVLLLPFVYNLAERVWPSIFPWNLGYPLLYSKLPIYQWADTVGFLGLSLVVLLMNAWVVYWWRNGKSKTQVVAFLAVFALLNLTGFIHGKPWDETDSKLNALIVQANIGNSDKIKSEQGGDFQEVIIKKFNSMTKAGAQAHPEADVAIWPETAIPHYMDQHYLTFALPQLVLNGVRDSGVALITGAYSRSQGNLQQKPVTFNAVAFFDKNGNLTADLYRKTHLLAYGEYLPFSEDFPVLSEWIPQVANFGRGKGPKSYQMTVRGQSILMGPQICYEGLYPEFSRGLAKAGAQIFVNVTNDSWYGISSELSQHLHMTFARAIENRRPLIRATNTGISSVVLANGNALDFSPVHEEWVGYYEIPFAKNPPLTFFSKWGHLEALAVAVLLTLVLALGRLLEKNARTRRP
jgi:apolipoprotein N-acyltransferase